MMLEPTQIRIMQGNGKTGAAFSIDAIVSCPGRTALCEKLCYTAIWPMSAPGPKQFRERNYGYVIQALKVKDQLSKELITACLLTQSKTVRIHDSGDFFSPEYVRQWYNTCEALPDIQFWAYTRSFAVPGICKELAKLATLPNVAIWISADADNWMLARSTYTNSPEFAGIAFMETPGQDHITTILNSTLSPQNYVNFPTHIPGGRIKKGVDVNKPLPQCPAIVGKVPHAKDSGDMPACLACLKCLPAETKLEKFNSKKIEKEREKRFQAERVLRELRDIQRAGKKPIKAGAK